MMKTPRKQNHKIRVSLWIDQDLAQIIKNNKINLNEELQKFFADKLHRYENMYKNTDVTFDSYPEVQNMIQLFNQFHNEATTLMQNVDLFIEPLVDIGTSIFYDDEEDDEEDNSCDRLSAYYSVFHQSLDKKQKNKQKNQLRLVLQEKAFVKKVTQLKILYSLNNVQLDQLNKKDLITYLLNHINNNRDIVDLLNYKNIRNQLGRRYTRASIAKKRYLLKKQTNSIY